MYQTETFIMLLAHAVIAGCWWFAAIRLQKHWILYAIAATSTIGPLLTAGMVFMAQISPRGSSMEGISHGWTLLSIADAVLFVIFAGWLVRFVRSTPPSA